jgi:hypothetical protein
MGYTIAPPMPRTPDNSDEILKQLEDVKSRFDSGSAAVINKLLSQLSKVEFTDPQQLIRFHECLLFLRAFPHTPSLVSRVERLLNTFHQRISKLRASQANMSAFDDFDTSGIAGTTMQDTLSFDVAQWFVRRLPRNVEIAWDDYWEDDQSERARGSIWPRFIPLLEEDSAVEANIRWRSWLDSARGRENPLLWLIGRFEQLPLPAGQRAEVYDSLRLPIRWKLENLKLSRTRNWTRPRRLYLHDAPLIQRSDVSLARELAQPAPRFEKLSAVPGESVMHAIREIMVVRYRELYGTTLGDPQSVVRADLGRGVVMHFWGLPPDRRLPLRAYLAGYTLKNGVPINYIEAIGLCEWIEVGFNTFYTYRQGETAWIYAQALRCLHALTAAKSISIYPYQIGQNNDEAIDSGAFWFYRKLGFRSGRADLRKLCKREEKRIAANQRYRTPARLLRRLAEAHMFYDIRPRAEISPAFAPEGPWETFSIYNLGLLINRRMSRDFNGDSQEIRKASTNATIRALGIDASRWSRTQMQSLENWSLILAQIPALSSWTPAEKDQLIKIIRAKSALNEMPYLRHTQHHPRLRAELLRLGSTR